MNLIRGIFELVRTGKTSDTDTVHGRVVNLLILVALLHFVYPRTIGGDTFNLIVYQLLYAEMFIAGILVASDSRPHLIAAVTTALIWFVCSVAYALDPTNRLKTFATYLALVPFLATIIYLLYR